MPSEFFSVLAAAGVLAVTYLVHSTLAIGGVSCAVRIWRPRSAVVNEQLWKAAAVVGVVTAAAQCTLGVGGFDLTLGMAEASRSDGDRSLGVIAGSGTAPAAIRAAAEQSLAIEATAWDAANVSELPLVDNDEAIGATVVEGDALAGETLAAAGTAFPALADRKWQEPAEAAIVPAAAIPVELPGAPPGESAVIDRSPALSAAMLIVLSIGGLALLWTACGGVRLVGQSIAFRRRLSSAREIQDGPTRRELDALLRRNRVRRRVALQETRTFSEPFACGFFRPRIVVPARIEQRLRRDELRGLLAHELAHLVRGDAAWLWIGRVLCSCLAFQPLNVLARRRWQRAEECLCDDWAVKSGASAVALARCLTRVAEWRGVGHPAAVALAAGGTRPSLSDRVERLIVTRNTPDHWNGSRRRYALRAALAAAAFALAWYAPRASLPAAEAAAGTESHDTDLAGPTGIEVRAELHALDAELQELERQMRSADALLTRARLAPEGNQLAQRLRLRMQSLERHRAELAGRASLLHGE